MNIVGAGISTQMLKGNKPLNSLMRASVQIGTAIPTSTPSATTASPILASSSMPIKDIPRMLKFFGTARKLDHIVRKTPGVYVATVVTNHNIVAKTCSSRRKKSLKRISAIRTSSSQKTFNYLKLSLLFI